jgi:hypothetical protein
MFPTWHKRKKKGGKKGELIYQVWHKKLGAEKMDGLKTKTYHRVSELILQVISNQNQRNLLKKNKEQQLSLISCPETILAIINILFCFCFRAVLIWNDQKGQ